MIQRRGIEPRDFAIIIVFTSPARWDAEKIVQRNESNRRLGCRPGAKALGKAR